MKKLNDKMLTKENDEVIKVDKYDYATDAIGCDCCNYSIIDTPPSVTEAGEEENNEFEQGHNYHHHKDNKYIKKLDNPKLLIVIGLASNYTNSFA